MKGICHHTLRMVNIAQKFLRSRLIIHPEHRLLPYPQPQLNHGKPKLTGKLSCIFVQPPVPVHIVNQDILLPVRPPFQTFPKASVLQKNWIHAYFHRSPEKPAHISGRLLFPQGNPVQILNQSLKYIIIFRCQLRASQAGRIGNHPFLFRILKKTEIRFLQSSRKLGIPYLITADHIIPVGKSFPLTWKTKPKAEALRQKAIPELIHTPPAPEKIRRLPQIVSKTSNGPAQNTLPGSAGNVRYPPKPSCHRRRFITHNIRLSAQTAYAAPQAAGLQQRSVIIRAVKGQYAHVALSLYKQTAECNAKSKVPFFRIEKRKAIGQKMLKGIPPISPIQSQRIGIKPPVLQKTKRKLHQTRVSPDCKPVQRPADSAIHSVFHLFLCHRQQ